ncbi:hypothetical protein BRC97_04170 [Halobacteriales archaeon QS_6_71_20]|nr:MAG: hypothetical protein BRC97_04170 [Halobacteriales archaeon QS_6_71_20]
MLPDVALADEECWRLESTPVVTAEYGTVTIPAGGTLTAFVGVYATPNARTDDGCFPTGDRRFESPYTVHPDGTVDGSGTTADWGFTLSVERIGGR